MKYRLIATDMDGTLLNDDSAITQRTIDAIKRAVGAGAIFVTATGRSMRGVEFINALFDEDMPFIIYNGASAIMGKSRKVLLNKYLDFKLAKEAYELGADRGVPMILWTDEHLWVNRICDETVYYREYYQTELNIVTDMCNLKEENIYKIFWIDTPEKTSRFQDEMKEHFGGRLNCHTSRPEYLEFVSPEAEKGAALAEVGKILGIDRNEMIAVGDGYNDISMLKFAGLGVAMENAPNDIKAVCDHVTLSNNSDGVAAVIERFILCKSACQP